MTGTVLNENEAAELVKARWFLEGAATGGKVPMAMVEAVRKATDHLSGQVTASAMLNDKEGVE